jgi:hypothetical protein
MPQKRAIINPKIQEETGVSQCQDEQDADNRTRDVSKQLSNDRFDIRRKLISISGRKKKKSGLRNKTKKKRKN